MEDSSFGRLIGVLVSPGKTFRSIAERPTWLVPFLVLMALSLGVGGLLMSRVDPGEMVRYQLEKFGDRIPPEQVEKAVEDAESTTPARRLLQTAIGLPVAALLYAALAGVFLVIFKVLGSQMTFKQSLSTYLYGLVPIGVVSTLINLPLMLVRESITPEEAMGGGVLVASPAILASEETSAVIRSLLGSLNFFTLWTLVLLAIGYRIVARVSIAVSAGTVFTLWLLYVAGKAGFAALFG
ncbi:MAG TPA: YIP1 family protein [Thermoanaerobaculia bacterium]|nr:YIP1 family protein [Thermoanaerobaculia bacterium]